jgi:hypothetical protein
MRATAVALLVVLAPVRLASDEPKPPAKTNVTVVAILASDQHERVDKKLVEVAREVQKKEPSLTGFTVGRCTCKSVAFGEKETFPLVEDADAWVVVRQMEEKENRISLTIKPPTVGEITYTISCGKFFPVVTRYRTKDKELLIIAVMVKPCGKK